MNSLANTHETTYCVSRFNLSFLHLHYYFFLNGSPCFTYLNIACGMKESHSCRHRKKGVERSEVFQAARPLLYGAEEVRPDSELVISMEYPSTIQSGLSFQVPPH